jgi:hypothetical protein
MLTYTAFESYDLLAQGDLETVALGVRKRLKARADARILVFNDQTGKQMDLDLSGSERDLRDRLRVFSTPPPVATPPAGPGRPKLGVIAREISLLPRHWEWLSTQTGGASATVRRLIEEQMKAPPTARDKIRQSQETTYKFLTALAGDLARFEDAIRYLYRRDKKRFRETIHGWPEDLVQHTLILASDAFGGEAK